MRGKIKAFIFNLYYLFFFLIPFRFVSSLLVILFPCRTFVWTGQWDQTGLGEVSGGIWCILRRFNWIPRRCLLSWWVSLNGGCDDVDLAANALSVFLSNSRSHIVLHTRHICWYWCCPCVCVCTKVFSSFCIANLQLIFINWEYSVLLIFLYF